MALQQNNTRAVRLLYDALARDDTASIVRLLAVHLEWCFHGPPHCHYIMQVFTGATASSHLRFEPQHVTAIGQHRVVAEGGDGAGIYWVHVWTIEGGLITQLREYFNTRVVVSEVTKQFYCNGEDLLWQSKPRGSQAQSLPELVLAI